MRDYWRYIAYIWRYKRRVLVSVASSFLAEGLKFASVGAFLVCLEVLVHPRVKGGMPSPVTENKLFDNTIGRTALEYLNAHNSPDAVLMRTIMVLGAVFLFVVLLRGILDFLREYLLQSANVRGWVDMTRDLFDSVAALPMRFFTRQQLGGTMSTFGPDLSALRSGGRAVFKDLVRAPFEMIIGTVATILISWRLWLVTFVALPIAGYVIKTAGKYSRRYTRKSLKKRSNVMKVLGESIQGAAVIKAYRAEGYQRDRFAVAAERMQHYTCRKALVRAIARPASDFLYWICRVAVALYGVHLVLSGELGLSVLVFFLYCVKQVYDPLSKLRDVYSDVQSCRAAAERVFHVMDLPTEVDEKPDAVDLPPHHQDIRFDHVSFAYDPPHNVVTDFDLTVPAGQVAAIVGENGSGKSTVINLLLRFYDPTEGAVAIDGHDLRDVTFDSLRRQIGYVSQSIMLFNDTIRSNIAFGSPQYTDDEIEEAARKALAHDFIVNELGEGYDTVVGEGGARLSGGQRQRVALARALLRDPRILVLDEATSALDVDAEHRLQRELDSFAAGRTVIIVSHRFSALRFADRVVVMANGRIERAGTHEDLVQTSPTYRKLHQKQAITEE
jgi:subfamily B ATP-binding cassette protein MsbA